MEADHGVDLMAATIVRRVTTLMVRSVLIPNSSLPKALERAAVFMIANVAAEAHHLLAMKYPSRYSFVGAALMAAAVSSSGLAADAAPAELPLSNFRIEIKIEPGDGPPRQYAIATTGGRVEASFIAPGVDIGPTEAPSVLKFRAEVEQVEANKLWLRNLSVGQNVPIVTGIRAGMPGTSRAFNEGPPGASRTTGSSERPNRGEGRRPPREAVEATEPQAGDESPPAPLTGRSMPPPFAQARSITYQDVGTISSVVLTIGKPVVVSEDQTQRVTLTAKRVD